MHNQPARLARRMAGHLDNRTRLTLLRHEASFLITTRRARFMVDHGSSTCQDAVMDVRNSGSDWARHRGAVVIAVWGPPRKCRQGSSSPMACTSASTSTSSPLPSIWQHRYHITPPLPQKHCHTALRTIKRIPWQSNDFPVGDPTYQPIIAGDP